MSSVMDDLGREVHLISSVRSMPSLYFWYPCADGASVMVCAVIKNVLLIAMLAWVKATFARGSERKAINCKR